MYIMCDNNTTNKGQLREDMKETKSESQHIVSMLVNLAGVSSPGVEQKVTK